MCLIQQHSDVFLTADPQFSFSSRVGLCDALFDYRVAVIISPAMNQVPVFRGL